MIKNLLTFLKITAVMIVILVSANQKTYATHAMGAQITYKSLGNNTFVFTYSFYFDCSSTYPMLPTYDFDLNSPSCNFDTTVTMKMDTALSGFEVTPVCPHDTTTCVNPNSIYPGVKVYIYTDTFNLGSHHCGDFYISYSMASRNGNINDISGPGNDALTVFAMLNDTISPAPNSPYFSNLPVPYICAGQTYCYNNGAVDPDGDSLVYSLMTPLDGGTNPSTFAINQVQYISGYSVDSPIACSFLPQFDSTTGTFCIDPSGAMVGVMAVLVTVYRHGVLIGEVERDIQLNIIQCTGSVPNLTGIDSLPVFSDTVCAQVPFTFYVYSSDFDTSLVDTMWWNNGIPGATFTVTGYPRPIGTFSWTPPSSATNTINYCFTVTVRNNACPYEGITTQAYCIRVVGANIGFTHLNVCTYNVQFHDTSTIPAGTITGWHWDFGDPSTGVLDTTSIENPNHIFSDTGFFHVRLVTTSSWGCNDTAYENIHVMVAQDISASSTNSNCSYSNNGSADVIVLAYGIAPFIYHWSNGATTDSIFNLGAGIYIVSVTDSVGCLKVDTVTVTAPPALVSNNTQHNIYCHDLANTGAAFTDASGGTGAYHYTWTPTGSTTASISGLTAGTYNVTITDAHGCTTTNSFTITHQITLGVDSFQTNVKCFGGNTGWAAVHVFSEVQPFTYTWTNTASVDSFASNLTVGTYQVIIEDTTTPQHCTDTLRFHITSPSMMAIIVDSATRIPCNGELSLAVVVDTGGVGVYTYSWSTSPVQTTATATGLVAGTYSVTVTDTNHCVIDTSITISQPALLTSTHSHTDVLCFGGNTGSATVVGSGGTTAYSYAWSPSGGNAAVATGLPVGLYTVVITDANGCTHTDTVTINQPPLLTIGLTVNPGLVLCDGFPTTLTASGGGGVPAYSYSWSSGATTATVTLTPNTTTTYTVTITDQNGCTHDTSELVTINSLPNPIVSDDSVCYGGTPKEWVTNPQTGWQYKWDNPTVSTSDTLSVNTLVTHYDSVFVTDANGCVSGWILDSAFIEGPQVIASFNADSVIGYQPLYDIFTSTSQNSYKYFWNFDDPISGWLDSVGFNVDSIASHMFDSGGVYKVMLVAENKYGCRDTTYRDITVKTVSNLVVYNVFSPNGDGKNDEWWPDYTHMSGAHVEIFNRWGLKVKEWYTLTGWDGTNNGGTLCPDGTYYYILFAIGLDGVNYHEHGFITLIK